jgi:hypothetical protein
MKKQSVAINRGISLLSVIYKVLSKILAKRLNPYTEEILGDYKCGFRRDRSTTDQIFALKNILEKCYEYNITLHQLFIDFKQAYDSVTRNNLYSIMRQFQTPKKLISLVQMTQIHEIYSSLMMEAVCTSETSVDNHFTQQYNPEDSSEHDTDTIGKVNLYRTGI